MQKSVLSKFLNFQEFFSSITRVLSGQVVKSLAGQELGTCWKLATHSSCFHFSLQLFQSFYLSISKHFNVTYTLVCVECKQTQFLVVSTDTQGDPL